MGQEFGRRHAIENRLHAGYAPVHFTDVSIGFKTVGLGVRRITPLVVGDAGLAQSALKLAGVLVLQPVFVILGRLRNALRVQANAVRYITFQFLGQFEGIPQVFADVANDLDVVGDAQFDGLFWTPTCAGHPNVRLSHVEVGVGPSLEFIHQLVRVLEDKFIFDFLIGVEAFDVGIGRLEDFGPVDVGFPQSKPPRIVPEVNDIEVALLRKNSRSATIIWW